MMVQLGVNNDNEACDGGSMVGFVCKRIVWWREVCDDGGIIVVQCMNSGNYVV